MSKKVVCRDGHSGEKQTVEAESLIFRPSVYGVIIEKGKVLLVPQFDGYDFPGGAVEKGETLEEALNREVKEETGLTVKKDIIISCEQDFFKSPHYRLNTGYHSILMHFFCKDPQGEISADGFDENEKTYSKKAEWIEIDRIDSLKFYNGVDSPAIIRKALQLIKK